MPSIQVSVETITPRRAQEYLTHNLSSNRRVRVRHVQSLARDIALGRWKENGGTICFNGDGTLYDGQHRLLAVIEAGKPIKSIVVRGVAHDSYGEIDTGSKRTYSDLLRSRGFKNVHEIAGGITRLATWGSTHASRNMTNSERDEWFQRFPEVNRAAELNRTFHTAQAPICLPPSITVSMVAAGLNGGVSEDALSEFLRQVKTGATPNTPAYRLRERLLTLAGQSGPRNLQYLHAITVKAWNLHVAGESVANLSWRPAGGERFPHMIDENLEPIPVTVTT